MAGLTVGTPDSYEFVQAATPEQWAALHAIRRAELFERWEGVVYDANHPQDRVSVHFPLVLKFQGKCIGTARLDLFGNGEAAIQLVAIAREEQRLGHGRVLQQLFEELARGKGVSKLMVNAHETAEGYYEKLGFIREDWNDPAPRGRDKNCVPMTKVI